MTSYDIYVFCICMITLVGFAGVLGFLLGALIKSHIKATNGGLNDEDLKTEYNEQKKSNKGCLDSIVTLVFCAIFVAMFVFSLVVNITGDMFFENVPTLKMVNSGSMSKKHEKNTYLVTNDLNDQIQTFDLVFIYKAPAEQDLKLYDVVLYEVDGTYIIHRIVAIEEPNEGHPEQRYFLCRGDANEYADRFPVTYSQIKGIYQGGRIPFVGSFVTFLQSPAGWVCLILVVVVSFVMPLIDKKLQKVHRARLVAIGYIDTDGNLLPQTKKDVVAENKPTEQKPAQEQTVEQQQVVEQKPEEQLSQEQQPVVVEQATEQQTQQKQTHQQAEQVVEDNDTQPKAQFVEVVQQQQDVAILQSNDVQQQEEVPAQQIMEETPIEQVEEQIPFVQDQQVAETPIQQQKLAEQVAQQPIEQPIQQVEPIVQVIPIATVAVADSATVATVVSTLPKRKKATSIAKKLIYANGLNQDWFTQLDNDFRSYKKVRVSISNRAISYYHGRKLLAKIIFNGRTLRLYLALNVEEFAYSRYFQKDASNVKTYQAVPFAVKVKSHRALKRARELVSIVCQNAGAKPNPKFERVNSIKILRKDK